MTKIAIKDAIVMIGHADPETKIAGWLAIGQQVTEARKRFGIVQGNARGGKAQEYRDWLTKSGIRPAVSDSDASRAASLFAKKKDLDLERSKSKIPENWTTPTYLLKAMKWISEGKDPKEEQNKGKYARHHNRDTTKDGELKIWSDGQPGAFYYEGIAFGNMMNRLPRMTKADQLKAVGAFFGTSSHTIKAERKADGSIRVFEKVTKDSPVDRAKFDITITFHKGVE